MAGEQLSNREIVSIVEKAMLKNTNPDPNAIVAAKTIELFKDLHRNDVERDARIEGLRELKDRCDDLIAKYGELYTKQKEKMQIIVGAATLVLGAVGAVVGYLVLSELGIFQRIAGPIVGLIAGVLQEPRLYSERLIDSVSKVLAVSTGGLAALFIFNKIVAGMYEGIRDPQDTKIVQEHVQKMKNWINTALVNELDRRTSANENRGT